MGTTTTSSDRTHTSNGPRAHRIVDDPDLLPAIALDLEPIAVSILNDVLIGLKARSGSIGLLVAAANASGAARYDALRRLVDDSTLLTRRPFQQLLHHDVAAELLADLTEALEEPARCDCGAYLLDDQTGEQCDRCLAHDTNHYRVPRRIGA